MTTRTRYDVLTWDALLEEYTPQEGMANPCLDVDVGGLRRALRELRESFGYECGRGDPAVVVERRGDDESEEIVKSES